MSGERGRSESWRGVAPGLGLTAGAGLGLVVAVVLSLTIAIAVIVGAAIGLVVGAAVSGRSSREESAPIR